MTSPKLKENLYRLDVLSYGTELNRRESLMLSRLVISQKSVLKTDFWTCKAHPPGMIFLFSFPTVMKPPVALRCLRSLCSLENSTRPAVCGLNLLDSPPLTLKNS